MTYNEDLFKVVFYMIIDAYKSRNSFGFDLHIEEIAPDCTCVGKLDATENSVRELDESELPESAKRLLVLKRKREQKVVAAKPSADYPMFGGCYPAEIISPEVCINEFVILYIKPMVEFARDMKHLKRLVKMCVIHELRHAEQFTYLRNHSYSVIAALNNENTTIYGLGPLESDAMLTQIGKGTSIEEAMSCFFN